ncbi:MAG: hypothetical protein IPN54_07315 [Bacteroidetes bacterium]|nr:hypothetical protein [Bacteroidota bacterium]
MTRITDWLGLEEQRKLFNGVDPDGPVLFGYRGGMLGTRNLGSHIEKIALQWKQLKIDVRIF